MFKRAGVLYLCFLRLLSHYIFPRFGVAENSLSVAGVKGGVAGHGIVVWFPPVTYTSCTKNFRWGFLFQEE